MDGRVVVVEQVVRPTEFEHDLVVPYGVSVEQRAFVGRLGELKVFDTEVLFPDAEVAFLGELRIWVIVHQGLEGLQRVLIFVHLELADAKEVPRTVNLTVVGEVMH